MVNTVRMLEVLGRMEETIEKIAYQTEQLRKDMDGVYKERNRLVALLANIYPSGVAKTAIEGWDPAWHNCVYIQFPTGQASWHYHDRDAHLFYGIPEFTGTYDGHTTPEKYDRIYDLMKICGRSKEIMYGDKK